MKIEYHYAPMTGGLQKLIDGVVQTCPDWATHNEWHKERIDGIANGTAKCVDTIKYGHTLFHGHSGRVDIYEATE